MAKAQGSYSITIKAIDATTTVVAKINKSLFNQTKFFRDISKHTGTLGKEFARFGKITGVTWIATQMKTLGGHIASAAKSTFNFFEKLAGLSGLLTVGGIVAAIRSFSSYSKDLSNNARQIGIAPKALQSWQQLGEYAAAVSPEAMTSTLQGLSKTVQDALYGRDPEAFSFLTKMGIELENIDGSAKDAGDILDQLRHKFSQMEQGPGKAAAKMGLISDLHLSPDIEPFLNLTDKEVDAARKANAKYNTITQSGIAIAETYRKGMVGLHFAVKQLSNSVAEALSPAFTKLLGVVEPLINSWATFIDQNKRLIMETTTKWVLELVDGVKALWGQVDAYVQRHGGWGALIQEMIQWVKDLIASIGDFATKVSEVATQFADWEAIKFAAIAAGIALIGLALSNPVVLTALAAWTAFYVAKKAFEAVPHDEYYRNLNPQSHDWDSVPQSTQELYPNSPYNQHMSGQDRTAYERTAPAELGGKPTAGPMTDSERAASKESFKFWLSKGLSPAEAAAMAAQEIAESGGDPTSRGDKDANGVFQAHGAYQWHPERRKAIMDNTGIDVSSAGINDQREAAFWEFTHNLSQAAKAIHNAGPTPREKGEAAGQFEGFTGWDKKWGAERTARGSRAEQIYNQNFPLDTKPQDSPGTDDLPTVMQRLRWLHPETTAKVDVSFNGFPPGLFTTQSSAQNMALNTSRTSGPIFA